MFVSMSHWCPSMMDQPSGEAPQVDTGVPYSREAGFNCTPPGAQMSSDVVVWMQERFSSDQSSMMDIRPVL